MKTIHEVTLYAEGDYYQARNAHLGVMERFGIAKEDAYPMETNFMEGIIRWRVSCTRNQFVLLIMALGSPNEIHH